MVATGSILLAKRLRVDAQIRWVEGRVVDVEKPECGHVNAIQIAFLSSAGNKAHGNISPAGLYRRYDAVNGHFLALTMSGGTGEIKLRFN